MLKEFFTKNRQHIIIIALFLLVSVVYCYPILSGKVMNQNDELTSKALNHEAEEYHKKTGDFIGWSNAMFGGMPTSVGFSGPGNYSIDFIYVFAKTFNGFSFDVIFWCFVGMYILLCILGITPWLGALGSFIFAFSTFNLLSLEGGHVQKTFNVALIPLLLGGIYLVFQKRYVWGLIAVAFGVNYQVGLGHYQVTYYAALAAGIMCIYYGVRWVIEKQFKDLGIAIVILLLGATLGTLSNLTVFNSYYSSFETTRGGASELTPPKDAAKPDAAENKEGLDFDYATQYSYGLQETFTLLAPNASGGADNVAFERKTGKPRKDSETYKALMDNMQQYLGQFPEQQRQQKQEELINATNSYWGDQPFVGGPYYFGIIVLFLFVIGIIASDRKEKWWIIALTVVFMLLAWGRHSLVYELFFNMLPVFNKFRTPSMAFSVVQIGFSLLAIMGLMALWKGTDKEKLKKVTLYTGIGFGLILLILSVSPSIFLDFLSARESDLAGKQLLPDWFVSALVEDREAMAKKDAIRSLIYLVLAFGIIWFYLKGGLKNASTFLLAVAGLIIFDLWGVNSRYLNKDNFVARKEFGYKISAVDNSIYQEAAQRNLKHYRVFNLTQNPTTDARTSRFHHSIGGYHGAKIRKYQELLENQISYMNPSVLSMLNTTYLMVDGGQGLTAQLPQKAPMGNAWFVRELKVVNNGDEEMAALRVDSTNFFEPAQTLVAQKKNLPAGLEKFTPQPDPSAQITLTSYAPHILKYEYNAASEQLAVFSEIYYMQRDGDGWNAYIDGKPAEHFRGDYVLRAMKVPAGKHTIEFKYEAPKSLGRVKLSFVFLLVMLGVSGLVLYLKKKGKLKGLEQ